jgi:hypothetical protein
MPMKRLINLSTDDGFEPTSATRDFLKVARGSARTLPRPDFVGLSNPSLQSVANFYLLNGSVELHELEYMKYFKIDKDCVF